MNIPDPIPLPERARMYAAVMHGAQVYNDEMPYTIHLERVVQVLERFGFNEPVMICAGWLHDSIEDTTTNYNAIRERFGKDVAELVFAVSSELGRNREERNGKTYPKIKAAGSLAIALKLADRIANVEFGLANGGGMVAKYAKEYGKFKEALYDLTGNERTIRMWAHLDRLSV